MEVGRSQNRGANSRNRELAKEKRGVAGNCDIAQILLSWIRVSGCRVLPGPMLLLLFNCIVNRKQGNKGVPTSPEGARYW